MVKQKELQNRLVKMFDRPGFLLRRAYQISMGLFEGACRDLSLTPAQFAVLSVVAAMPGIDQARLARTLGFDKVTIMHVLRGMADRGLVERVRVAGKGRRVALSLTSEGMKLLEQAQAPTESASESLLEPFTQAQRKQFIKLLKILNDSLEDKARAPLVAPDFTNGD